MRDDSAIYDETFYTTPNELTETETQDELTTEVNVSECCLYKFKILYTNFGCMYIPV